MLKCLKPLSLHKLKCKQFYRNYYKLLCVDSIQLSRKLLFKFHQNVI